jgi:AcrR family transcriptional regulator
MSETMLRTVEAGSWRGARAAFLRFGFERSSMADIAEGAGVSRTAPHHYFLGKEDVFKALVEALHARTHTAAIEAKAWTRRFEGFSMPSSGEH